MDQLQSDLSDSSSTQKSGSNIPSVKLTPKSIIGQVISILLKLNENRRTAKELFLLYITA